MLQAAHIFLPAELRPTAAQAKQMAAADIAVFREFGFTVSPKTAVILAAVAVHLQVYQGGFARLGARLREQRAAMQPRNPMQYPGAPNQPWGRRPPPPPPAGPPGEEAVLRSGTHAESIVPTAPPDGGKLNFESWPPPPGGGMRFN